MDHGDDDGDGAGLGGGDDVEASSHAKEEKSLVGKTLYVKTYLWRTRILCATGILSPVLANLCKCYLWRTRCLCATGNFLPVTHKNTGAPQVSFHRFVETVRSYLWRTEILVRHR